MNKKNEFKMRLRFSVGLLLLFFCSLSVFAQDRTISGVVRDTQGEPIIGANVMVKGTGIGSATDINGNYTLSVPGSADALQVSYIGMKDIEVPITGSVVNITMEEDVASLEEVVVVGYGTMKKSDLTGSISSVSSDRITSIGTSSVMGALQGASAGVDIITNSTRPGASFNIQIRGQNSLQGGNPLYVVDGVIVGDIDFLNPSDIEKIDVLKDASSTAIYGSRGSNGVVVVQTKGSAAQVTRTTVSYDGYYGVRNIARIPDFMDGREWIDFRTSRYYTWDGTNNKYILTASDRNAVTQNSKIVNTALYNEDYTDWLSLGTKSGSQQNHYLNIMGMGGNITYNIGMGFQNEVGNFLLEQMDKYSLNGSINHEINDKFSAGANFILSHQIVNTGSQYGYRDLLRLPNVLKAYDDEGKLIEQPGIAAEIQGDGNFTSSANPLIEIESGSNETRRFDVLASTFLEFRPIKDLSFRTTLSPRFNRTRIGYYREANANRTRNQAANDNREYFDWTWDNVVNYQKSFAGLHNLNLTLISSMYKTQYERLNVYAEDFPYNSEWYNIFNGTVQYGNSNSSYSQTSLLSYAARANYDFAGKYMLTGTVRYDGSSKLANKWAAFPSVAAAWRISEESFLQQQSWLDNLKLRLSYGFSGNNNGVSAYGTQAAPNTGNTVYYDFNGNIVSGFGTGAPVNTNLTWEKTRELNFGIDFAFFNSRVNGTIDLYDKLSDGLLMNRTLTIESGVSSMVDNIGSVNNRGFEVTLNTLNVKTKDWDWRTTLVFAMNKNAIRSLYGRKEDVVNEARFIGKPINVIYDYLVDGVYSQAEWSAMSAQQRTDMGALQPGYARAIDTNGDGKMTTEDRIILGQVDPKWTGSINSSLTYKNFDFGFNIYTRQGVFLDDNFLAEFSPAGNNQRGRPKVNMDYYIPGDVPRFDWSMPFTIDENGQAWAPWGTSTETPNAKYPINGFTGNFYGGNGRYQDASFVKVRNITLGYSLPASLLHRSGISYARVYVNVLNPFTFTDYIGWDPEYATTSLQNGNGPSTITYQVGINLKF